LFKTVRSPDFAHAPLAPAQLDLLMRIQFAGQKQTYGLQYPDGDRIVLVEGEPIGRIWLFHGAGVHQLVDIALMPEFQNRGIGSALVTEAIATARAAGVRLCCSVAANNRGSLSFHQRLGFRIDSQDGASYNLSVEPEPIT
jgi:ribosomal protein S18 acetylase RimI-like enzyme